MKQNAKKVFSVIVLSVYFALCYFMLDYMTEYPFWILISMFASVLFMFTTHELGHLIFGYLTGYQFISYRIFSLTLVKENGKFRFCRMNVPGTGGQCLMAPPEKKNGKYPFVLYNLGGILFCGILSLIPISLSLLFLDRQPIGMCLFIFGFVSFVMNLLNAIPTDGKGMVNDATNLRMALGNPRAQNALWNQLQYCALHARNIRTADMPEEIFFIPEKKDLGNVLLIWQALAYIEREEDRGNYEKAREYVHFVLDHAPFIWPVYDGILRSEAVFLNSLLGCDPTHTDAFYEKIKKIPFLQKTASFQRARYAYFSLFKKDSVQAAQARDSLEKIWKKIPFPSELHFEQDQIRQIENILSADSENGNTSTS